MKNKYSISLLLIILVAGVAATACYFKRQSEQAVNLDRVNYQLANHLSQLSFDTNILTATVVGDDPYLSLKLAQEIENRYLKIDLPQDHHLASITLYYGFRDTAYSEQSSFTRKVGSSSTTVTLPLPDGVYDRLRIDFNGVAIGQKVRIGKLIVAPADEIHFGSTNKNAGASTTLNSDSIPWLEVQPGQSFWIINSGESIISNPRFVAKDGLDVSSYNQLLSSLYQKLPQSKKNREELLLAAWRYLGREIKHHCSPGRKHYWITDPLELIAGYGYGCCTHTNRALTKIAEHLGFESRFISTYYHEYPEIKTAHGWQILDANRGMRWFAEDQKTPLIGIGSDLNNNAVNKVTKALVEGVDGQYDLLTGSDLANHTRDLSERYAYSQDYNITDVNPDRHFNFYPEDRLWFATAQPVIPLTHAAVPWNPPHPAEVVLTTKLDSSRPEVKINSDGYIDAVKMVLPFPVISVKTKAATQKLKGLSVNGTSVGSRTKWGVDITREDLSDVKLDRDLEIKPEGEVSELSLQISMQYNPKLFGIRIFEYDGRIESDHVRLIQYRDDTESCAREITIGSGSKTHQLQLGQKKCNAENSSPILSSNLRSYSLRNNIRHMRNCSIDAHGIKSLTDKTCQVTFSFSKKGHKNAALKLDQAKGNQWYLKTRDAWRTVNVHNAGRFDWLLIKDMPDNTDNFILRLTNTAVNKDDSRILSGLSYEVGTKSLLPKFFEN